MAMKAKIIGYGISGKAAESYLTSRQVETVVVADANETVPADYDFCVVSPGVPAALVAGETVPVVPEVELPFYLEPKIKPRCLIGVTGTNGKTTIVNQITKMCAQSKPNVVLCGNVGTPVSRVADQLHNAIVVVEVSSFMLEQTKILRPNIAVLTNITPDHLDRHQTMAEYQRCKQRIVAQQKRGDILVVNWDDPLAREVGLAVKRQKISRVIWYSTNEAVKGYYVQRGMVYEKRHWRAKPLFAVADLGGMPHTVSNALAVVAVGRKLKIPLEEIITACQYQEQPHRVALVADQQGLAFYDDSKATNIASTLAAVRAFSLPITLIVCGLTKGQDYQELFVNLPAHVQQVIVFGACRENVLTAAREAGYVNLHAVEDLTAAVKLAVQLSPRPGIVLFSPAGSSFDQFANYQARGDAFQALVTQISPTTPQCSHPTAANH